MRRETIGMMNESDIGCQMSDVRCQMSDDIIRCQMSAIISASEWMNQTPDRQHNGVSSQVGQNDIIVLHYLNVLIWFDLIFWIELNWNEII